MGGAARLLPEVEGCSAAVKTSSFHDYLNAVTSEAAVLQSEPCRGQCCKGLP